MENNEAKRGPTDGVQLEDSIAQQRLRATVEAFEASVEGMKLRAQAQSDAAKVGEAAAALGAYSYSAAAILCGSVSCIVHSARARRWEKRSQSLLPADDDQKM